MRSTLERTYFPNNRYSKLPSFKYVPVSEVYELNIRTYKY